MRYIPTFLIAIGLWLVPASASSEPCGGACFDQYKADGWATCGACFDRCRERDEDVWLLRAAKCYRKAGRPDIALARCSRVTGPGDISAECRKWEEEMEQDVGRLRIGCLPGARVSISDPDARTSSGHDRPQMHCPVFANQLLPGRYTVTFSHFGRSTAVAEVEVVAGRTATLTEPAGAIDVQCQGPGARVSIVDTKTRDAGGVEDESDPLADVTGCPARLERPPGTYRVVIGRLGEIVHRQTVTIAADRTTALTEPHPGGGREPEDDRVAVGGSGLEEARTERTGVRWGWLGTGGALLVLGGASHALNVVKTDAFVSEQRAGRLDCTAAASSADCRTHKHWIDGTYWTSISSYALGGALIGVGLYLTLTDDSEADLDGAIVLSPTGFVWRTRW